MQLSNKQKYSIKSATARINLWEGSVQSGKTIASLICWILWIAASPPGKLIMVGKTDKSLKRNIMTVLQELLGNDLNYSFYSGEAEIWGRKIYLYGANDESAEKKIRGLSGVVGAYGDEITLWLESFFTVMLSRMSASGARFFGTLNCDSPFHWLLVKYLNRIKELSLKRFIFYLEDNESLDPEYVRNLKLEYTGLWFKRFILSLWVAAQGAIYDSFSEETHTISNNPIADYYLLSVDYGASNPFSALLIGVKDKPEQGQPKVWVEREYYYDSKKEKKQKTNSQYSQDLKEFLGNIVPRAIYVDPSELAFITQLKSDGFFFVKGADNAVLNGIRFVSDWLHSGKLKIHKRCVELIRELLGYSWDPKAQIRGEDKPIKSNDHGCDSLRYGLYSHFGGARLDYSKLALL